MTGVQTCALPIFSQAIREGRLKAIREAPGAPIQVFDLFADPGETRDLAATETAFVRRATELFTSARTESEHWPIGVKKKKSP